MQPKHSAIVAGLTLALSFGAVTAPAPAAVAAGEVVASPMPGNILSANAGRCLGCHRYR